MRKVTHFPSFILVCWLFLCGCAGHSGPVTPVTEGPPDNPLLEQLTETSGMDRDLSFGSSSHFPLAYFMGYYDPDLRKVQLVPLRDAALHLNVLSFLEVMPCTDCLQFDVIGPGGDGTILPLADGSMDVVVCNQIYEHVDSQEALMLEIYRVLKYDGFCFFGAGNRYVVIEGHYFLPFLSWLPHRAADLYMKLAGKKAAYDVRLLSLGKLKRLTRNFWIHDYTGMIFENPHDFCAEDVVRSGNIITRLPRWIYRLIYPMLPAWVWVLTKRK